MAAVSYFKLPSSRTDGNLSSTICSVVPLTLDNCTSENTPSPIINISMMPNATAIFLLVFRLRNQSMVPPLSRRPVFRGPRESGASKAPENRLRRVNSSLIGESCPWLEAGPTGECDHPAKRKIGSGWRTAGLGWSGLALEVCQQRQYGRNHAQHSAQIRIRA